MLNLEFLLKKGYSEEELGQMSELNLSSNQIKTIDVNLFKKCSNLTKLDLSKNKLKEINRDTFKQLTQLTQLILDNNQIESIEMHAFKQMYQLSEIYFDNNHIESISLFAKCSNLTTLYLSNNKLREIDRNSFNRLTKLTLLSLSGNQIQTIDVNLFESCSNLKYLYLENNELREINRNAFKKLTRLDLIDLSVNQIETIDVKLFKTCSNLTILNLDNNKLREINRDTFKKLKELIELWLKKNQIETIDLNLLEKCSKLKNLWLDNNKLKEINREILKNLPQLTELGLSYNQIETIDVNLFDECLNLTKVLLSNNKLREIDRDTFKKLRKLIVLDLSNNSFLNELNLAFETENLDLVNFSFNNIKKLKLDFSSYIPEGVRINISSNDIHQLSDICINSNNNETKFEVNARFNFIQSVPLDEIFDGDKKIRFHNFKFDLSRNPLNSSCFQKIKENSKYQEIFEVEIKQKNENLCIKNINFDLIKEEYQHIENFKNWNGISSFSVITGKNGVGKSTVLSYIKDYIHEFYKNESTRFVESAESDNNKKRISDDENKIKLNDHLFIPVVYKMHEKIKPDMENVEEIKSLAQEWYNKKDREEKWYINQPDMSEDIFNNVLKIFSVDSIDKLIIQFSNNITRINQDLHDFKYEIELFNLTDNCESDLDEFNKQTEFYLNKLSQERMKLRSKKIKRWKIYSRIKNSSSLKSIDKFISQYKIYLDRINKISDENRKNLSSSRFIDKDNPKTIINSSSLSPGEQLILMFRLWEFALTRYDIPHTPVLLLDEPDAHLHPKAVRDFVDILSKLAKAGAQVIMTTHNPTTVSFIPHENLYCMKKREENGEIVIEKSQSKADIVRELTSNLLVVNANYRTVLVEGEPSQIDIEQIKYDDKQLDSIFYQNILNSLSESGFALQNQYLFKSFNGCANIMTFMKFLDKSKIYQDHLAIIDNDNYLRIVSNQDREISEYYDNIVQMSDRSSEFDGKVKNVYHLMRHSFENYALDPVNLFCYLNYLYSRNDRASDFKVDKIKLDRLYEKITQKTSIDITVLKKIKHLSDIKKMINNGQNKSVQSIISAMGDLIMDYLCEKEDGLNHRLFNYSDFSYLSNLIPIFRFIKKNEKFCSVQFSLDLKPKKWPDDFFAAWKSRMNLHKDNTKEKVEKIMDICAITKEIEDKIKKILKENLILKEKIEKIMNILKDNAITKEKEDQIKNILRENELEEIEKEKELEYVKKCTDKLKEITIKEFGKTWSAEKTKSCINILKKLTNQTSEVNRESGVSQGEWRRFLTVKDKLDEILIDHIRTKLLDETIDCCFAGIKNSSDEQIVFKYPKVFYYLNGHFFEEIIYSMFFDTNVNVKIEKSMLIDKIVRDDGLMNERGYLVPNDLCEIFKRIDRFKMPTRTFVTNPI